MLVVGAQKAPVAQWTDVHQIAKMGGESTIASDGVGNVYVTAHGPAALYKSSDWGGTFTKIKDFSEAQCDLCILPRPDGHVNTAYIRNGVSGIGSWYSTDFAANNDQGQTVTGSLDREWIAADPKTGRLFMDFSDGYIGGPNSKGVFLLTSDDNGKTFSDRTRVDREPDKSYGVDPYIARGENGRVYCMWQVTTDSNTIDAFRVAYSADQGKTFSTPVTVATFPKQVGGKAVDTQERWILGSLLAVGKDGVVVDYPGYEVVIVDNKPSTVFVRHYAVSTDGGNSFGPGHITMSPKELQEAVREFRRNGGESLAYPYYIQNLPWLAADGRGHVHLVFTDNRDGASTTKDKDTPLANWRVRHIEMDHLGHSFGKSEAVSEDYAARRPPMDFISCSADSKYVYASWTEIPGNTHDWVFSGNLWAGRKPLK